MHCYACDGESDKMIHDTKTGRYYCRSCIQPTLEELLRQLLEDQESEDAGPFRSGRNLHSGRKRSFDLLAAAGFEQIFVIDTDLLGDDVVTGLIDEFPNDDKEDEE